MELIVMVVVLGAIAALALGAVARDIAGARRRARMARHEPPGRPPASR